jgi:iron complex outermembrane receptor protein
MDRLAFRRALYVLLALFLGLGISTQAQSPPANTAGSIAGKVTTPDGTVVTDASVLLADLRRSTKVAEDGTFRFDDVPPGEYLLEASSDRLGAVVDRVTVPAGGTAEVTLAIDLTVHRDEILVTASPDARSQYEIAQPTSVLDGEELQLRLQPTLGETLSREPGVTSTFFGQGASRPVIRGLGGDRIRVLEGGIGVGDASATSPDHAVSVDPLAAERIEVLRGPATLLYGSSAVGGVVNVIDDRIPDSLPESRATGIVELRGGTVADERGGIASVSGALGRFAWHADFLRRETDDYEIPGAESSVLPNSATETESGSLGFSHVAEGGFLGVSTTRYSTLYGIPGGDEAVRIDLDQERYDLRGGITRPFAFFRGANLRFGTTDYEHVELEGAEVGTIFRNESWEGRFELLQKPIGPLSGSVGLQAQNRDFEAIGDEAFVPPTQTGSWALFTFQEIARGPWRYQFGARYEAQDVTARTEGPNDRSFDGVSGSFGLVREFGEDYTLGLSLARSTKLPNAEELFSNGPHIATNAFEIGDPDLDEETSLGADLTLRRVTGRLTGEVTLFVNRFDDYIYESFTGEEEDGLTVFRYVQDDAEFRGAELTGVWELYHGEPDHLDVEFGADFVRAELRETGEPLPRIPSRRYRLGLHYRGEKLQGLIEGQRVEEQDRVAAFERPTEGYTLLNASLGYRFFAAAAIYDVLLRGTNLTDQEARNHVSFLKDRVPMPGRDVSLSLRVSF